MRFEARPYLAVRAFGTEFWIWPSLAVQICEAQEIAGGDRSGRLGARISYWKLPMSSLIG